MRREDIEWRSGKVVFWDLDFLELEKPIDQQLDDLKEDLAQAEYAGDLVLDVGWYPSFSKEGSFVVRVVSIHDWDTPLYLGRFATAAELLASLPQAVAAAERQGS